MIERGPIPAVHGVVRWRMIDLAQWILRNSASQCQAARARRESRPWATSNYRPAASP